MIAPILFARLWRFTLSMVLIYSSAGASTSVQAQTLPMKPVTSESGAIGTRVNCEQQRVIDWKSYDDTVKRLRQLYSLEQFQILEQVLTCLMRAELRFSSGKTGASAVYWLFRGQMPAPGTDPEEKKRIDKWNAQFPTSIFPKLAGLRFDYSMAWNARGSAPSRGVSGDAMTLFTEGLAKAEANLLAAPADLKNTPIWQNLMLAVVQDSPSTKNSTDAIFTEGVQRWPDYFDFYEVALTRKVPRWGGSWEAVDAFINYWSEKRLAEEGKAFYARLYSGLLISRQWPPEKHVINWIKIKASLDDLVARYPDKYNRNLQASFACALGDKDYFNKAVSTLAAGDFAPAAWPRDLNIQKCSSELNK